MRNTLRWLLTCVSLAMCAPLAAQSPTGTLVVDIKPFTSDARLSKGVKRRLENAGLEWGVADGKVVFTQVNKQFVNFDLGQFTRFGETDTVELPAGEYRITCIGFINEGGLLNPEKALNRGAYLNIDVVTFTIAAGQTTTLLIEPVMQKQAGALVNLFMPDIVVTVPGTAAVTINERTAQSVPWSEYTGPLKL